MKRIVFVGVLMAALLMPGRGAGAQASAPTAGNQAPETMIIVLSAPCPQGATSTAANAGCPAQASVLAQLLAAGAAVIATTTLVDTITARMIPAEAQALASFPGVSQVVPDSVLSNPIHHPATREAAPPGQAAAPGKPAHAPNPLACGTQANPALNPEALQAINAPQAQALGFDGAGVTVAYMAEGIDVTNPDFQRNPAYGAGGAPIVTQYDFSGEGTNAPTTGGEAFLDASSIAAQGNTAYNLAQYVSPVQAARLPAAGCWIKILGAAPSANIMGLKVFAQSNDTTISGFLQAIQYAVQHGVKVINQSFGSNNFPDTTLDVIRAADDDAVAAGVTVVVSSGDAGNTNTIGAPASDPNVISVGASTTFGAYAQDNYGGIYNPTVGNGQWVNNNISAISSGGFTQAGNTVDLVAPGDLNWALCSANTAMYSDCTNENGAPSPIELSGGTSESAPLTAAAAADVIQAYAQAHGGASPSPALVKQILMSTATDIDAPASEQGAGLLNIQAAVQLAASLPGVHNGPPVRGMLVSPGQVNIVAAPNTPESQQISITNAGSVPAHVDLSTRALTQKVSDSGVQTFTLDPRNPTTNTGTIQIWSGVTEVYQAETFTVPKTDHAMPSRLMFSADYQFTGQSSLLHVALFDPDGTYAGYSLPQGLADYAEVEVANPETGVWTAVFFTAQNAPGGLVGTSGPVQWDASTWEYAPAGSISPSFLNIFPGQTATATLSLTTPAAAGDTDQSIVISSPAGQTTVPVTVRTIIPVDPTKGGTFSGVLTGGNGRQASFGSPGNFYSFSVPAGEKDMDVSVALANDPCEEFIAYLVDPEGQTVGYSSNFTVEPSATSCPLEFGAGQATQYAQIYHVAPEAGQWSLLLNWSNPVSGNELQEPFTGSIQFNQVSVSSDLPDSPSVTLPMTPTTYQINIINTGVAPEAFFADARLANQTASVTLPNWNPSVNVGNLPIPLPPGTSFPYYVVPTHTSALQANVTRLSGTQPVTFDMSYFPGDPDVSPNQPAPGVTNTSSPDGSSAGLTLTEPSELSPGLWLINPDEFGPYPAGGANPDTANATLTAVTAAFDPAVTSNTDDLWQVGFAFSNFLYLLPGQSGTIHVQVNPTASPGSIVSGTLYVDDITLAAFVPSNANPDGDELAAIPYEYTVGSSN
jgi:hypothetical protein